MTPSSKIRASHLSRLAIVYVRQSTSAQVRQNTESTQRFTPKHVAAVRGIYKIYTPRTVAVQDGEISVKQAAHVIGIPDAIYNWLRHGQVPANIRAGRWCIPWDPGTQEIYRQKVANSFRLKPKRPA